MGKGDSGNAWAQPTPFSSDYAWGLSLQDWLVPCLCTGTGGLENRQDRTEVPLQSKHKSCSLSHCFSSNLWKSWIAVWDTSSGPREVGTIKIGADPGLSTCEWESLRPFCGTSPEVLV